MEPGHMASDHEMQDSPLGAHRDPEQDNAPPSSSRAYSLVAGKGERAALLRLSQEGRWMDVHRRFARLGSRLMLAQDFRTRGVRYC
jgi:hypothetical protein